MWSQVGETVKLKETTLASLHLMVTQLQSPQMHYMHFDGIWYLLTVLLGVPDSRKSFFFTVKLVSEGNNSVS